MLRRTLVASILGLSALLPQVSPARELVPAEKRIIPYVAELPPCTDPGVLAEVSGRFADKESGYWNSPLTILSYDRVQPVAFRPWGLDTIPRRYCTANAAVSDGSWHRVDFSVREDLGFIGAGWNVEFCVTGLDRNLAYSPACRMARP